MYGYHLKAAQHFARAEVSLKLSGKYQPSGEPQTQDSWALLTAPATAGMIVLAFKDKAEQLRSEEDLSASLHKTREGRRKLASIIDQ